MSKIEQKGKRRLLSKSRQYPPLPEITEDTKLFFRNALFGWAEKNPRPLPWKDTKDPYLIWLSEIILQQTRVEQGLPYFEEFRRQFPDVHALAAASEDEVMKLWEGLGYYSRARHLHQAARHIVTTHEGVFPNDYDSIRRLKGVGDYSAAAIASFAFELPHAVVDGNVYRVLSRFFGIEAPIDSTEGKKLFAHLATDFLDTRRPGEYNQAIMNFGAMQCLPVLPKCSDCPFALRCGAFRQTMVNRLPVKSKKSVKKTRYFHYLVLNFQGSVVIRKRTGRDIWRHLYEFPMLQSEQVIDTPEGLLQSLKTAEWFENQEFTINDVSRHYRQILTHQTIVARFWDLNLAQAFPAEKSEFMTIERKNLSNFAFPKIISLYLQDKVLLLNIF